MPAGRTRGQGLLRAGRSRAGAEDRRKTGWPARGASPCTRKQGRNLMVDAGIDTQQRGRRDEPASLRRYRFGLCAFLCLSMQPGWAEEKPATNARGESQASTLAERIDAHIGNPAFEHA